MKTFIDEVMAQKFFLRLFHNFGFFFSGRQKNLLILFSQGICKCGACNINHWQCTAHKKVYKKLKRKTKKCITKILCLLKNM